MTAYQSASGFVNYVTPTSAVVMGGLVLAKVRYDRYLRFVAPLPGDHVRPVLRLRRRRQRPVSLDEVVVALGGNALLRRGSP